MNRGRVNNINKINFSFLAISLLIISQSLFGQADKKYIRKGNRNYEKSKYPESEIFYRKATDKKNASPDGIFNTGDALYKQKKYEEAGNQFIENVNRNEDNRKKSDGLYNLGNSLLMSNKVKESIDAYKGSLKMNPSNMEAKYNLAYAQDLLKQQEQQQKQQQQQNKDGKGDQDKKNDQKKDQAGNQDDKKQQNQDQKDQQQQQSISKEDADRLLEALANDERSVQEKVKLAKASKSRSRTIKNW